jgi:23S rRNA (guanosine2251-2'-O)-methyltransferase
MEDQNKLGRINPIIEWLKSSPNRINKIFIQKERGRQRIGEIIRLAKASSVPLVFVPKQRLDSLYPHHQGAVALVAEKEYVALEDLLVEGRPAFLVILDEIEDPQNVGAIIRNAEGAGADGIILPERRSAGLTSTVATVAAGALSPIKVARVPNLARAIEWLKEKGVWVVGTAGEAPTKWYEFDFTQPVAIVLGSEGSGIRANIKKKCDALLSLPMQGNVSSLNVSAAAAVFFFEVVHQRKLARTTK